MRVLENRSYLIREKDTGRYRLGLKLMSLTRDMLTHLDIRKISRPIMEDFVKKVKLPMHLAVLDNGRAVYVEKVEAESFVKMDIWVGHRLPIHTTAIGKVLVSQLSDDDITGILDKYGMERKTSKSITTQKKYLSEMTKVRKFGFAVDNEENSLGVRCVAAPVYDSNGKIIAALGTSSTIMQIDESQLPKVLDIVKNSAFDISNQMGYQM